ncbi:CHAT domain-containing protein [Nocardia sp. NPDC050712]|uniref:CHAT domain-containing protein n=1 Tax=Nocardia sp. NPDC050712 TaxID=3155518 RepID=UPI0033C512E5
MPPWLWRLRRPRRQGRDRPIDQDDVRTHGYPAQIPISDYRAYPRLEVRDFLLARKPVDVRVGLAPHYDPTLSITGEIHFPAIEPALVLEAEVLFDPRSFTVDGPTTISLKVSAEEPFPSQVVRLTPQTDPHLTAERTLRVLYRHHGNIIGIASRTIEVVGSVNEIVGRNQRGRPAHQLLDLAPLLHSGPPDLVLVVFRADEPDTYVWDAYPFAGHVSLSDGNRRSRIDSGAKDFASFTRRAIRARKLSGIPVYDQLVGYGDVIHEAIPAGVRTILRDLVADRSQAPTMLLLTEEAFVPWELAVFDPPLRTEFGGAAPFLGAHIAVSRWPFTAADTPSPINRQVHHVARQAVVTADYEGVLNWKPLPAATAEADRFRQLHGPVVTIEASREKLIECLDGREPVDLLHVAMHGAYDSSAEEDGLVFPLPDFSPSYLTSLQVRGFRNRTTTPFVYLNACEVGAGDATLGSYAGFAVAVLRTGAIGVIAPLWNVDDHAAAELAGQFYAGAYGRPPVPVAELLRRMRSGYTRAAVAEREAITPTAIAFVAFCHPRLTLLRTPTPES